MERKKSFNVQGSIILFFKLTYLSFSSEFILLTLFIISVSSSGFSFSCSFDKFVLEFNSEMVNEIKKRQNNLYLLRGIIYRRKNIKTVNPITA